jgi:CheY-like chemotaxis protein
VLPTKLEHKNAQSSGTGKSGALSDASFDGKTALVVDDVESVRELVQEILASLGFIVHSASNGKEAIQIATERGEQLDVLISDLEMPDMHGLEVAERIARLLPGIGVVYMSGTLTREDWRSVGVSGMAVPFLKKPFGVRDMADVMRQVFNGRKSRKG